MEHFEKQSQTTVVVLKDGKTEFMIGHIGKIKDGAGNSDANHDSTLSRIS